MIEAVKILRAETGAGMMACKEALAATGGDLEAAKEHLRKKGLAAAAKRADRVASEGVIGSYVHMGRIGTLVEVRCETDFVARTPEFQALAKALAMQVAAAGPRYLKREEVPADVLERERAIHRETVVGKPPHVAEKIVEGKVSKYLSQICLLDQDLVVPVDGVPPNASVRDAIAAVAAKVGEKVEVVRFARIALGES